MYEAAGIKGIYLLIPVALSFAHTFASLRYLPWCARALSRPCLAACHAPSPPAISTQHDVDSSVPLWQVLIRNAAHVVLGLALSTFCSM